MGEILGQTTLAKQLDSGSITSTRNADAVLDSFDFWLFNIVTPPQLPKSLTPNTRCGGDSHFARPGPKVEEADASYVRCWHKTDIPPALTNVRYRG
jgi:hypothetical protein